MIVSDEIVDCITQFFEKRKQYMTASPKAYYRNTVPVFLPNRGERGPHFACKAKKKTAL